MKIDGKENVNIIRLEHRGFNLKFQQANDTRVYTEYNPLKIAPTDRVTIEFDDTLELDHFISVLQRFRDELWRKGARYRLRKEAPNENLWDSEN